MSALAALDRTDVAVYIDALFTVYIALIIVKILLGWIQLARPLPYNMALRSVTGFVEESVEPYLNVFRGIVPSIGGGGMSLDLSPMLGIILLFIAQGIVVGAIAG